MKARTRTVVLLSVLLATPALADVGTAQEVVDCLGPVDDVEPGSAAWRQLLVENAYCAEERHLDKLAHPTNLQPLDDLGADAYREPSLHDDVRFRFDATTVGGMEAEVYRPCAAGTCPDLPSGLATFEPPYPAVVVFHGGASFKELHWWSSQVLAEAGYLVVTTDSSGQSHTREEAEAVLDWLHDEANPLAADFDGQTIGLAGHSAGGVMVSRLGQEDPRVDAVVSWDRAQSTEQPDDVPWHAPALYLFADWNCQQVPVCQPDVLLDPPQDPTGPGNKGRDFELARAAGIDTMQIALRAALHLDWVPSDLSGNRWAEPVTLYHTLAWFDRWLRGAHDPAVAVDAHWRLTGRSFDDSVDVHALSQGIYDPAAALAAGNPLAGNQPYMLAGLSVPDRLSFLYLSRCAITDPVTGELAVSEDLRTEPCVTTASPPDGTDDAGDQPGAGSLPSSGGGFAWAVAALVLVAARRAKQRKQVG